jgi:hypothetical protein
VLLIPRWNITVFQEDCMHPESKLAVDTSGMLTPQAMACTVTVDDVRVLAPKLGDLVRRLVEERKILAREFLAR